MATLCNNLLKIVKFEKTLFYIKSLRYFNALNWLFFGNTQACCITSDHMSRMSSDECNAEQIKGNGKCKQS